MMFNDKQAQKEPTEQTDQVSPVRFAPLARTPKGDGVQNDATFILDIPVTIVAEIGQAIISVRDLLNLDVNSVVELDKSTGEAVDILANNRLVAKGEVVVFGEKFAVRITEFLGNVKSNAAG